MDSWKQTTYKTGLEYCFAIKNNPTVYKLCVKVLNEQGLADKYMDGTSVQKIPIIDEGKTRIIFTDIFWSLAKSYITPAIYVASIVDECVKKGIEDREIVGMVGRGLRAFPSFLREMDLKCKIASLIPGAEITSGPQQDVGDHTDILIKNSKNIYRVWSYQNFERGLINTSQRFSGKRGALPRGIHVFCPIDIGREEQVEEVCGWCFYSERYVRFLVDMIEIEKPEKYADLKVLSEYALKLYLRKANIVWV